MNLFNPKKGVNFIDGFQLHNLINNQVGFVLINLSPGFSPSTPALQSFFDYAKHCLPKELEEKIQEWTIDTAHPVVLIHEKESTANRSFHRLAKLELVNLYVVKGGWLQVHEYLQERE